jgi:lipase chaperone LimK
MAGPLPASLQHVPVPGDLHVGQDGRFEPTAEAIQLFDHFLQARSEAPLNVLYDRTVAEIQARLPPDAADQAVHLLERYIVYRRGVAKSLETTVGGWKVSPLDVLAARQRLQFGDDLSERLFGEQARRDREAFRQSLKLGDPGPRSHPGEGPAAPATGRPADSAPGDDAPEFAALHLLPLRIQEQELRDRGGGAEEVRALREKLVGPDVADRLDALDRQKADWRQRVALYRAERGEIERLAGADAEQRRFLIEQLQVEHFAPDELLRIELLDRVDLPPALWKP